MRSYKSDWIEFSCTYTCVAHRHAYTWHCTISVIVEMFVHVLRINQIKEHIVSKWTGVKLSTQLGHTTWQMFSWQRCHKPTNTIRVEMIRTSISPHLFHRCLHKLFRGGSGIKNPSISIKIVYKLYMCMTSLPNFSGACRRLVISGSGLYHTGVLSFRCVVVVYKKPVQLMIVQLTMSAIHTFHDCWKLQVFL